jgi:sugar lactone lactonase YvrE
MRWVLTGLIVLATTWTGRFADAQTVLPGYATALVLAGNGTAGYAGDGALPNSTSTELNLPGRVLVDGAGNVFIADTSNNVIRMISASTGIISTVAGGGTNPTACPGSTDAYGDGCTALNATFATPYGMALDGVGNLYVADYGHYAVRMITQPATGNGTISTVVGKIGTSGTCSSSAAAGALAAALIQPKEITFDTAGNMYIAETGSIPNNCAGISVIANTSSTPGAFKPGALSTLGTLGTTVKGVAAPSSGTVGNAELNYVDSVFADKLGNLYAVLVKSFVVVKISNVASLGNNAPIAIVAGTLGTTDSTPLVADGDGGLATSATMGPESVLADDAGNLYIVDQTNLRVREVVAATGYIFTVAGNGQSGASTACCGAVNGKMEAPTGIAIDAQNNLYVTNTTSSNRLDKFLASAPLTIANTAVGSTATSALLLQIGQPGSMTAPVISGTTGDFTLGAVTTSGSTLPQCTANGTTSNPTLAICSVAVTFSPKHVGKRTEFVSVTDQNGVVYTFGVTGTGTAPVAGIISPSISLQTSTSTLLKAPNGSAVDSDGNLYLADTGNNVVRKVTSAGVASVIAGTGTAGFSGDGSSATSAKLNAPRGVVADSLGNIYIADTGNDVVRVVNSSGVIHTVAGTGGTSGFSGDLGPATSATLNVPAGVAADLYGNIYIADTGNNVIRRVNIASNTITTIAGSGSTPGFSGDGGNPLGATLSGPLGITVDAQRDVYIADTGNDVIREINASTKLINTIAGTGGTGGYAGSPVTATQGLLNAPSAVALDAAGDVYIADTGNSIVQTVSISGIMSTIAGVPGGNSETGDGGAAQQATFNGPYGLSIDGSDNMYVVDSGDNVVRIVPLISPGPASFADTAINTTSVPTTIELQNIGNANLNITSVATTTPVAQTNTTSTTVLNCASTSTTTSTSVLTPGAYCYAALLFKPTTAGTQTSTLSITDNSQNTAGSVQSVPLTGKGVNAVGAVTITVPTVTYGTASQATITVATVAPFPAPTGTVTYDVDSISSASVTVNLVSGSVSVSLAGLTAGTHTICANYSGDTNYGRSTGCNTFTVTGLPVTLSVKLSSATPAYGLALTAAVSLSVTSSNAPLSGKVSYSIDGGTSQTLTLGASGTGTISLGTPSVGSHTLIVNYAGGSQYGSASSTTNFTVSQATTSLTLSSSFSYGYINNPVTFTATVNSSTAAIPTGLVQFFDGSTLICPGTGSGTGVLANGSATCTMTYTTTGTHSITASYAATTDFTGSTSTALTQSINNSDFTVIPQTLPVTGSPATPISAISVAQGATSVLQVELQGNNDIPITAGSYNPTYAYNGTVTFSCSGLPSFMGCTFLPTFLTITNTTSGTNTYCPIAAYSPTSPCGVPSFPVTTLTIETFGNNAALQPKATMNQIVAAGFLLPGILFAGWIGTRRRTLSKSMRRRLLTVVAALCLGGIFGLSGCSYNIPGTMPGTYAVSIIGTDSTNQIVRSAVLNVTVTAQ